MSNLHQHAWLEFKAAGWVDADNKFTDDMQEEICKHILKLLDVFSDEGHSGTTAPYTVDLFKKLAMFEPIVPLTGEDWEWSDVSEYGGSITYQNKRCSHVFKDADGVYDINGKVFWEWAMPYEEGMKPYKSHYTCRESRVPVTFPYIPKTEYVWRWSEADPRQPKQTEEGFVNAD